MVFITIPTLMLNKLNILNATVVRPLCRVVKQRDKFKFYFKKKCFILLQAFKYLLFDSNKPIFSLNTITEITANSLDFMCITRGDGTC